MTAVFGWRDDDAVFLVGNSAVTSSRPPRQKSSSFGEAPVSGDVVVEEGAIKILHLPRGLIVGVAGDALRAKEFLRLLTQDLQNSELPTIELVENVAAIFAERFELLLGYCKEDSVTLARVSNRQPYG
jgi:hypothetical protein